MIYFIKVIKVDNNDLKWESQLEAINFKNIRFAQLEENRFDARCISADLGMSRFKK